MKIRNVAVIGAGTLGIQIAIQAVCHNDVVRIYDLDGAAFSRAMERIKTRMKSSSRKPTIPWSQMKRGAGMVHQCDTLEEAVMKADLVIESVPENLALKRKIFRHVDAAAPRKSILATNSSSMPVSWLENATGRPEKCVNLHFYGLDQGRNIVDVMGGTRTAASILKASREWVRSIGCIPLAVKKEIPGFCFNRIWRAVKREALHMWAEGYVDFRDIDRGWMNWTGMSPGPFGLMDSVGLDVVYDIEMIYYRESRDPKDRPPRALKAMVDRGSLGVKAGKGFYTYPDPEFSRPGFLKASE